jgi:hypothetical protein
MRIATRELMPQVAPRVRVFEREYAKQEQ